MGRVFLCLWFASISGGLGVVVVYALREEFVVVRREVRDGMYPAADCLGRSSGIARNASKLLRVADEQLRRRLRGQGRSGVQDFIDDEGSAIAARACFRFRGRRK